MESPLLPSGKGHHFCYPKEKLSYANNYRCKKIKINIIYVEINGYDMISLLEEGGKDEKIREDFVGGCNYHYGMQRVIFCIAPKCRETYNDLWTSPS